MQIYLKLFQRNSAMATAILSLIVIMPTIIIHDNGTRHCNNNHGVLTRNHGPNDDDSVGREGRPTEIVTFTTSILSIKMEKKEIRQGEG